MMASALFFGFLFLVFAPCLVASSRSDLSGGQIFADGLQSRQRESFSAVVRQAMLPETELAKDFEIRSFPKGIAQRRLVVQDSSSGVKLTIAQVRVAAAELVRLGGWMAEEFCRLTVAGLEAMHTAYAWFAWQRDYIVERRLLPLRVDLPPRGMWREATRAA